MDINNVTLSGRLADDPMYYPDPEDPKKNRAWCRLAVNRIGQDKADFLPFTVWGKKADNVARYCRKGKMIGIEGRLQENNKPKADGSGYDNYTEVSVRLVHFGPDSEKTKNERALLAQQQAPVAHPNPVQAAMAGQPALGQQVDFSQLQAQAAQIAQLQAQAAAIAASQQAGAQAAPAKRQPAPLPEPPAPTQNPVF
jgi:single-strand DNA-binding protein